MPKTDHQATQEPIHAGDLPPLQGSVTPKALLEFGGGSQTLRAKFFLPTVLAL